MAARDAFSGYHPAVCFLYFVLVLGMTMLVMHPVTLAVSLGCAVLYSAMLGGRKAIRFQLRVVLPMVLLAAVLNPAFNHAGVTVLAYLPTGNPLTLESILYGLAAAVMLAAAMSWFSCYTAVMTSDKFVYLFGRVIPALSLVLSMTLRFVPRFASQMRVVREAQSCIGRGTEGGSVLRRIRNAAAVLSIMVTWALENAISTADSMKSRGYGLPGRTSFAIYRLDGRDRAALAWLCACGFYLLCGGLAGGLDWHYVPSLGGAAVTPMTVSFQLAALALCLTPVAVDAAENRRWRRTRENSKGEINGV